MRSIDVNFAPAQPPSRLLKATTGLMIVATLVTGSMAWHERQKVIRAREIEVARQNEVEEIYRRTVERRSDSLKPLPYAADALRVLRLREFPLNAVLTALETVSVAGIRILSVDISAIDATARVEVEFSDYQSLIRYLEELNIGEPTERWVLTSAQTSLVPSDKSSRATLISNWRTEVTAKR